MTAPRFLSQGAALADFFRLVLRVPRAEMLSVAVITPALRWALLQKKTPAPREELSEGQG